MVAVKKETSGERGKKAEKSVQDLLTSYSNASVRFSFLRLPDARAAGGRLGKMVCDYLAWYLKPDGEHLSIQLEVKETEKTDRIARDKLSQIPKMRLVAMAGGHGLFIIFHSKLNKWRPVPLSYFGSGDEPSYDVSGFELYDTARDALASTDLFPK